MTTKYIQRHKSGASQLKKALPGKNKPKRKKRHGWMSVRDFREQFYSK